MILRLLQLAFVFFLFSLLLRTLFRPGIRSNRPPSPEKTARGEEMVQDPHCGTYVPISLAVMKTINGRKVYFCSEKCREAYHPPR